MVGRHNSNTLVLMPNICAVLLLSLLCLSKFRPSSTPMFIILFANLSVTSSQCIFIYSASYSENGMEMWGGGGEECRGPSTLFGWMRDRRHSACVCVCVSTKLRRNPGGRESMETSEWVSESRKTGLGVWASLLSSTRGGRQCGGGGRESEYIQSLSVQCLLFSKVTTEC